MKDVYMSALSFESSSYSGGSYSSGYKPSYEKTSIESAIGLVISGNMDADLLFVQLSLEVQTLMNKISNENHCNDFLKLSSSDKKSVFITLLQVIKNPPKPKKMSLIGAIQSSSEGRINPLEVFNNMPIELKKDIGIRAKSKFKKDFQNLSKYEQETIFKELLQALKEQEERQKKETALKKAFDEFKTGKIDAITVFNMLPQNLKQSLDSYCQNSIKIDFHAADINLQNELLQRLYDMFSGVHSQKP